ncbi:MAG: glycosyltransferase family 9 protein [Gemmataceae bacterium]|nr:glycosyltransferase family 9 protein [Gemmataceae bacterium]
MPAKDRLPLSEYPAQRIAIIKPSALGDVVHSLPVLSALRRRYPEAHISWVINRGYAALLEGHPDLDEVLPFDRTLPGSSALQTLLRYSHFCRGLHRRRFDLVIDLQGLLRTGIMTLATQATRRVGLSSAREGATWFYTDRVPVPDFDAIHAVDRYWLVAEALGAGDVPKTFHVPIGEAAQTWAGDALAEHARPWIAVGVGSRWMTKRWPPEHFATLVHKAQERCGGTAIFVGGRDETELARKVARRVRGSSCDLTGRTSLQQLAALLQRVDVMIANDTGPLHLAAALGRPVVAPYTCTKVRMTGPYGAESGAVETRVWCQGSLVKRCDRLECMTELTPFRLWPVLQKALEPWERNSRTA